MAAWGEGCEGREQDDPQAAAAEVQAKGTVSQMGL